MSLPPVPCDEQFQSQILMKRQPNIGQFRPYLSTVPSRISGHPHGTRHSPLVLLTPARKTLVGAVQNLPEERTQFYRQHPYCVRHVPLCGICSTSIACSELRILSFNRRRAKLDPLPGPRIKTAPPSDSCLCQFDCRSEMLLKDWQRMVGIGLQAGSCASAASFL